MKKRSIVAALGLVTATAGFIAAGPSATAADQGERAARACTFTLYQTANFRDGSYGFSANDRDLSGNYWNHSTAAGKVANDANSARNRCGHVVTMHNDKGYGGQTYGIQPRSEDGNFENNNFANKAESLNGF
jgi:hypothetical protein